MPQFLDKTGQTPQHWLDSYRWEHNYLRPHEALGMQTPASRWRPSPRRYDPNPPRWQYPEGAWVLKVDCRGKLDIRDRKMAHRPRSGGGMGPGP